MWSAKIKHLSALKVLMMLVLPVFCQQGPTYFELHPQLFRGNNLDLLPVDLFIQEAYLRDSTYVYTAVDEMSNLDWELSSRSIFHYNSNGLLSHFVTSDLISNQWKIKEEEQFFYRPDGRMLEHVVRKANPASTGFNNYLQTSYSYTYFGEISEVYIARWIDNWWAPVERIVSSFDDEYSLVQQVSYTWDEDGAIWKPAVMVTYNYEDDNIAESQTLFWNEESSAWDVVTTRTILFDDGMVTHEMVSVWSSDEGEFEPTTVITTDYNELGQPIAVGHAPLADGSSDWADGTVQWVSSYSDKGQLQETILSIWDDETQTWQPDKREVHYWSKHLQGLPSPLAREIHCTFANPYLPGLPWHCENLNPEVFYEVTVSDLTGRIYHKDTFKGGQTFRIRTALPRGFYIVRIAGGLDLHAEKILVR